MQVLIVANGNVNDGHFYKKIISDADLIIAADGGADNCIGLGLKPDYIIGDMDSISDEAKKKFKKIIIRNVDQDTTDMEKAIKLAQKNKCESIVMIGAIGSRMDHTISNILCLAKTKVPSKIVDGFNEVFVVESQITLTGKKGDIVSVIPVSNVQDLSYEGLKWNVKDLNVNTGWLGISNVMIGSKAKIRLKSGKIIVIKSRDRK